MSKKRRANDLDGGQWLKNSFSIWRNIPKDLDSKDHPATFPVALAAKVIECFASEEGGLVLDPFAGSGSTLLAAVRANMRAIGFDINPEWRALFERRLTLFDIDGARWQYEVHDARHLAKVVEPGSVEICLTSPPYWDILNRRRSADGKEPRSYSCDVKDLGNLSDYGDFLDALSTVATQVESVLRDGGYFVLNVMDIRKGPNFYPLHIDAVSAIKKHTALSLEDIIIWDRQADYNGMRPLGYPYKFIVNKVHEYLLIFRRQNGR